MCLLSSSLVSGCKQRLREGGDASVHRFAFQGLGFTACLFYLKYLYKKNMVDLLVLLLHLSCLFCLRLVSASSRIQKHPKRKVRPRRLSVLIPKNVIPILHVHVGHLCFIRILCFFILWSHTSFRLTHFVALKCIFINLSHIFYSNTFTLHSIYIQYCIIQLHSS